MTNQKKLFQNLITPRILFKNINYDLFYSAWQHLLDIYDESNEIISNLYELTTGGDSKL